MHIKLPDDELLEQLKFSLLEKWQVIIRLHDFNYVEHTLKSFVSFCTRLEMAYDGTSNDGQKKSDTKSAPNSKAKCKRRSQSDSGFNEEPGCSMHISRSVYGHVTHDCYHLKNNNNKSLINKANILNGMVSVEIITTFQRKR